MKRVYLLLFAALCILGLGAALYRPGRAMASRDLGCAGVKEARGKEICHAISASMEWTWMGHAIVSPGWRPTWNGMAHVWCAANVSKADLPALEKLRRTSSDWRLESGADSLIRIAKAQDSAGGEPENSIFNPRNPSYVLKGGCPGR